MSERARWALLFTVGMIVAFWIGFFQTARSAPAEDVRVYVSLDRPCRLFDIRPNSIPSGSFWRIDVVGQHGACDIPDDATDIFVNITALNATEQTNLRFWPSGAMPNVATMNPLPGQTVFNGTPIKLDDGAFLLANAFGQVEVVIDVVAYWTDEIVYAPPPPPQPTLV